jgi:hypothetical protein
LSGASDGVLCTTSDKTHRYEQLRTQVIETPHGHMTVVSAVVFIRQGMGAWMQLDEDRVVSPRTQSNIVQHRTSPLAPEHSELLAVLTSLVFNLCNQKESA